MIDSNYCIYGLSEINTEEIKYIGVTKVKLKRRLWEHLNDKSKTKKNLLDQKCQ